MHKSLISRIIAFAASLVLTMVSFWMIIHPEFFHIDVKTAIPLLLILALFQAAVQSIFFLHILSEKGPRWNLVIFASTVTMLVIIVVGTIWIMNHLNYNMH